MQVYFYSERKILENCAVQISEDYDSFPSKSSVRGIEIGCTVLREKEFFAGHLFFRVIKLKNGDIKIPIDSVERMTLLQGVYEVVKRKTKKVGVGRTGV